MSSWYVDTLDRDGNLYTHYRHGTFEEVEEQLWLDFPDHVVVDFIENPHEQHEYAKELDFNDMD